MPQTDAAHAVAREFEDARRALDAFCADPDGAERVAAVARRCAESLRAGGRILAAGNGGSAADAMHFCEELTGRYRADRPPIGAVACTDPGYLTCAANDYGYDDVFARWLTGVGRPGDVAFLLSTSGNSENILRAAAAARAGGLVTVALLGKGGGRLAGACDHEWIVPGEGSDRVQEIHMLILHTLVGAIERELGYA